MNSATRYFLGSNTNEGFYSLFDELYDPKENWTVYVIKGGPGCGKSTLMGKIAAELEKAGLSVEKIMCASDPKSYDAVICREIKFAVADGTAPHVIEPKYYGAVEEIINMGEALDTEKLREKADTVRELFEANACCYRKTSNYLKAAAMLQRNSKRLQDEYIDYEKLYNYVVSFAKRELSDINGDGEVKYRFLTAVTNEGEVTFTDGIEEKYRRIICIDDPVGSVGGQLLDCLLTVAVDCGMNAVAGVSPFDTEELLQLFFPDKGIAVIRKNEAFSPTRTIHAARFVNGEGIKSHKYRIAFNKKAAKELVEAAVSHLKEAKEIHDEIEKAYVSAIDYEKVNAKSDEVLERVRRLCESRIVQKA